ncbi:MAG: tRNA pseudouridine synthase 1 [Thelocarpon superellum]|nr:MAG: tRNA pseudouridine synthase 1 [Thelocarpon superellum]
MPGRAEARGKTGDGGPREETKVEEHGDKRARREGEPAAKKRRTAVEGEEEVGDAAGDEAGAEERKPKRKVAVLIGYSGTGYKGMQLNATEKTIEGDLFEAFVAAGAISRANSDDPKKSSLVRCARTDKGVHAAGNVISLKLIVEEADVVQKINDHLSPQIRVWGIQRTNGSFSCYQLCDSRIYEYLIPTHAFLPPHPRSPLAKVLLQAAEATDLDGYKSRQEEVASFWNEAEQRHLQPVLETIDPSIRSAVLATVYASHDDGQPQPDDDVPAKPLDQILDSDDEAPGDAKRPTVPKVTDGNGEEASQAIRAERARMDEAIRKAKAANLRAKKSYRISPARLQRIRDALALYHGTRNFHNYTPDKSFYDPSAKRHIKSFVADAPLIIGDTEWVSLKVHGQSFMMHQIRKMVGMVALVVRAGCVLDRVAESYGPARLSIPKAPGIGLLLERPIFDSYNDRAAKEYQREPIDFGKYEAEIKEFKQREIYERIFREEEQENHFHAFFANVDALSNDQLRFLTSHGLAKDPKKGGS